MPSRPSRPSRLIVAVLVALLAFLGAMSIAQAAGPAPAAAPGSYAQRGAPVCDDRGASAYATEPAPPPVEGGTIAQRPVGACTSGAWVANDATAPSQDDLHRVPAHERDVAVVPTALTMVVSRDDTSTIDEADDAGPRDGFGRIDSPPPRPIPWRR